MRPTRTTELPLHNGGPKKSNITKLNNAFEKVRPKTLNCTTSAPSLRLLETSFLFLAILNCDLYRDLIWRG